MSVNSPEPVEYESSVNIQSFLMFLVAMTVGLLVALLILPIWLPNMAFSLGGDAPKAYWYLSRATAFVSLSLLWLSMALGLGITNKMARLWPGAPAAFALHEYVSLAGFGIRSISCRHHSRRPLHQLYPAAIICPIQHRGLSSVLGRHGSARILHMGNPRAHFLHPPRHRAEVMALPALRQFRNVSDGNFPWPVQRHRHQRGLGAKLLLDLRWQFAFSVDVSHPCGGDRQTLPPKQKADSSRRTASNSGIAGPVF